MTRRIRRHQDLCGLSISNRPGILELRAIPSAWHLGREHKRREPQRASLPSALQSEFPLQSGALVSEKPRALFPAIPAAGRGQVSSPHLPSYMCPFQAFHQLFVHKRGGLTRHVLKTEISSPGATYRLLRAEPKLALVLMPRNSSLGCTGAPKPFLCANHGTT